jgi:type IV pilus assembly protein PilC
MSVTTYTTRALDPRTGSVTVKKVDGQSEQDVRAELALQGLTPLTVTAAARGLSLEIPGMAKRIKSEDLTVFTRMFATLVSAAMPVVRSLTILTKQTQNPTLAAVLDKVTVAVQAGKPVSAALAEHPEVFPPLMVNLIRAGEVGGFLEDALVQVADTMEADAELRSEIKGAATRSW